MALIAIAIIATAAASCVPRPPVDLSAADGRYAVSVERNVEMTTSDGRILRADIYRPTDPSTEAPLSGPFPVIVGMTPYGKSLAVEGTGSGGVNLDLVRSGYISVVVDVPGTGVSDGRFALFSPAESEASVDVIRWAAALPGSNGKVGMIGHSYSAINQLFAAAKIGRNSPLKAIFPMSATADPYRDLFVSGGALNVMSPLGLLFGYGITRSLTPLVEAGGDPLMAAHYVRENFEQMGRFEGQMATDMVSNGPHRYFDSFWAEREPAAVLQQVVDNDVAVYMVGGLYDVFQRGVPLLYSGLQNASIGRDLYAPMLPDQPVSAKYQMMFGPWTHGGMVEQDMMTSLQKTWFDHWLKGVDNGVEDERHPITILEPDGISYRAASYPLEGTSVDRLWLRSDQRLADSAPVSEEQADSIEYLPLGEPCSVSTVQFAAGLMADECLKPQLKERAGPGFVSYTTGRLSEPMQVAGPIGMTLRAISNTPDTFFSVILEDVAPDGTSMDITGGAQLGSLRTIDPGRTWSDSTGSMIRPYLKLTESARVPVKVGTEETYRIEIRPAFATVAAGHSLRVRISTSDFPHIIPLADLWNLIGGHYQILHGIEDQSFIDIPVRRISA